MDSVLVFLQSNSVYFIKIAIALFIFFLALILKRIYVRHITTALQKKFTAQKHPAIAILLKGFHKPIGSFIIFTGLYLALSLLAPLFSWFSSLPVLLYRIYRMLLLLLCGWGLAASSDITSLLLTGFSKKLDRAQDETVNRFLSRLFRVLICIIFSLIAMSELGFNVTGLLTGLGLGGLTFALAAQDSAANFFGGIVILFDRPFSIGDWICCGTIEGQVEDISFRSTQIRTAQNTVVIVPNSKLSGEAITNWTRLNMRQIKFTLTLRQDTPIETLHLFLERLRSLLKSRDDVHPDTVQVHFNEFGDSSYDIYVLCFSKAVDLHPSIHTREEINFQILELMEELHIGFAYPTRTILTENTSN